MSEPILIVGESGAGKSSCLETMNSKETFVINCIDKSLPFQGWKQKYTMLTQDNPTGNLVSTYDSEKIVKTMQYVSEKRPEIKVIFVDDLQYVMSFEFVARIKEKGYDKFSEMAKHMLDIFQASKKLRNDLIVVFTSHSEDISFNGMCKTRMKTIGKLLEEKITPEGLFTIVLYARASRNLDKRIVYKFETQTDGTTIAKSPRGMFKDFEIENDLHFIYASILAYNNGEPLSQQKGE